MLTGAAFCFHALNILAADITIAAMARKTKNDLYYSTWTTAWGPMGAVAGKAGVTRIVLPHYKGDDLKALLAWEHPSAKCENAPFVQLTELSREYFNGNEVNFGDIECDLAAAGTFTGKALRACREIPYAQTRSYLDLSKMLGSLESARAVATAMGSNAIPLVIPCHRVIYSNGNLGGFSAEGGTSLKQRMINLESAAG